VAGRSPTSSSLSLSKVPALHGILLGSCAGHCRIAEKRCSSRTLSAWMGSKVLEAVASDPARTRTSRLQGRTLVESRGLSDHVDRFQEHLDPIRRLKRALLERLLERCDQLAPSTARRRSRGAPAPSRAQGAGGGGPAATGEILKDSEGDEGQPSARHKLVYKLAMAVKTCSRSRTPPDWGSSRRSSAATADRVGIPEARPAAARRRSVGGRPAEGRRTTISWAKAFVRLAFSLAFFGATLVLVRMWRRVWARRGGHSGRRGSVARLIARPGGRLESALELYRTSTANTRPRSAPWSRDSSSRAGSPVPWKEPYYYRRTSRGLSCCRRLIRSAVQTRGHDGVPDLSEVSLAEPSARLELLDNDGARTLAGGRSENLKLIEQRFGSISDSAETSSSSR